MTINRKSSKTQKKVEFWVSTLNFDCRSGRSPSHQVFESLGLRLKNQLSYKDDLWLFPAAESCLGCVTGCSRHDAATELQQKRRSAFPQSQPIRKLESKRFLDRIIVKIMKVVMDKESKCGVTETPSDSLQLLCDHCGGKSEVSCVQIHVDTQRDKNMSFHMQTRRERRRLIQ